jgi:hypothetical protein
MDETWTNRDLPVLKAAVDIYNKSSRANIRASDIQAAVNFDKETTQQALRFLCRQPFFEESGSLSGGGQIVFVGPPTGEALRVAGAWPTPEGVLERLVAAFEAAASDQDRAEAERRKFTESAELSSQGRLVLRLPSGRSAVPVGK